MGNKSLSSSDQPTRKIILDLDNNDKVSSIGRYSRSTTSSNEEDIQSANTKDSDKVSVINMLALQWKKGSIERKQKREAKLNISALETELKLIVTTQNY